ncbi:helix-turn-helix domain-containing protein [Kitasatospora azatica]|uniref:helix-turn-helix domain-containing protein n=1 Tax=Kitasatospora azatica TaxID=58347 RepID=UPI00055DAD4F|nr:helix-turn-helix transcriptional regulator [Kitasatospora azatica]
MAPKRSPALKSVYRRQLASRLKELRERADLTMAEVAAAIEVNQGSLSRIESGDRGTSPILVKAMLDCYGVTDPVVREDILDLVRADAAQRQQWWRKYSAVINTTRYGGYLALESSASSLHNYEPTLMPGLLQTEEYARKVITAMRVDLTPDQVEDLVKVRMARKKLLEGPDACKLWAVIDEAAIRRIEDSPAVLKGQLEHLVVMGDRMNVTIQLMPFSAGFHPGLDGSFVLMGFAPPNPDVVWVENGPNSVYFEGSADVERYTGVFDHLRARALGPPETRSRIYRMIEEL